MNELEFELSRMYMKSPHMPFLFGKTTRRCRRGAWRRRAAFRTARRRGDDFALSNRRVVSLGQPPQPLRRRAWRPIERRQPRSLGCGGDSVGGLDGGGNGGGGLGTAAVASSLSQRHCRRPLPLPPAAATAQRCILISFFLKICQFK